MGGAVLVASTPFGGMLTKALPAPEQMENGPSPPDAIRLLKSEINLYPDNHVLKSVCRIEILPNPAPFDEHVMRGMSLGTDRTNAAYWAFKFDETNFLHDIAYRRGFLDDMAKQLVKYWKKNRMAWGIAHEWC